MNNKIISFCKWCQHLPPVELAQTLKKLGFDGVDLPCRPGSAITHANGPQKLPEYKKIFEDHGLSLERLATSLQTADDEADRFLAAVSGLGIKKIRINAESSLRDGETAQERLSKARKKLAVFQKLLAKHGVQGGIQNHSGGNMLEINISCLLLLLRDCDPQWVGIQYDPGHALISGEPIRLAISLMGEYLHSVNIKSPRQESFINPDNGRLEYKPVWVPLKDGMLDIPALLSELKTVGYKDAFSLHAEYRSHFHHVARDLEACNQLVANDVDYLKKHLKHVEKGR